MRECCFAIDTSTVDPNLLRQEVAWQGRERPAAASSKYQNAGFIWFMATVALRYGIDVGRTEALNFRGSATIGRKKNGRTGRQPPA